jgi:hypothetical protein
LSLLDSCFYLSFFNFWKKKLYHFLKKMLTYIMLLYLEIIKFSLQIEPYLMAERMGFEPMKEFLLYTLSKRAPSTTRPPLPII